MFSACRDLWFWHAAIEMTACNLRSLLVAAIFLSNCITWTASRHQYTHSLSGHRIRHRRQGKGLYLSASYVLPGGEGSGWGEWGEVSPCSRTCGGGVASQKRICLQIGPDGQPYCTGGSTKYFSCQTQDCPDVSIDFRAQQCSEFDDTEFRGYKYKWVPYTKAPNPCELNCMPHGERFYYRHKEKVIDGTRCNEDSFDVCVNGLCQPVGCDMMLGSKAEEDKCRVCRGNGESCRTYGGIYDSQELIQGYTDIMLIPSGSTTIIIEEIAPSRNYLALRAQNGTYYLNGHYHIDFPRSMMIAGALWYYERSPQGFTAPDKLRTQGPTNEPLYLSILLQDSNVGIKYEYSVPNTTAPPTDKQYGWVHDEFTPCSDSCGGGFQTRNVTCRSNEELDIVEDSLCDDGLKPPTNQSCNTDPCPAQWVDGDWGNCSKRCGEGGVRSRAVRCEQIIANGHPPSIIDDKECLKSLGPKPDLFEKCNEDVPCPTWFVGKWKHCDHLCDEGKQTRQVVCHQRIDGRVEILEDDECADEKPETEKACFLYPCDGVDWVTTDWIGCDSCLSTNRSRVVVCAAKHSKVVNESFCSRHTKPAAEEPCDASELPACEVQWYATQWSKCSVECGEGTQNRKVFCGLFDGASVLKVDDKRCAGQTKYNDTKKCVIPKEKCPSQWYAGPWEKCSKDCDGGVQNRRVMCFSGDKKAPDCDGSVIPESSRVCNTGPCNEDTLLPVHPSAPSITTELPYCDEEEDYKEVGLDELLTTMQGDSPTPSFAEFEATADLGSGSGMGSTFFDELSTTDEGSGFTFTESDSDSSTMDSVTTSSGTESIVTDSSVTGASVTDSTDTTTGLTDSNATESIVTDSTVTDSSVTESSVTGSTVTESSVTESSVTDSSVTDSSVTDSSITETSVTDSSVTPNTVTDSTVTDANATDSTATEVSVTIDTDSTTTGSTELDKDSSITATDLTAETGTSPTLTTETSSDDSSTSDSDSTATSTELNTKTTEEDSSESSTSSTGSTEDETSKTTESTDTTVEPSSVTTESSTPEEESSATTSSVTDSSDTTTQESQSSEASSSTVDSETESVTTEGMQSTTIASTNESSEPVTDSSTTEGTKPTDSSETTEESHTTIPSSTSDESDKTTDLSTTQATDITKTTDISETTTESETKETDESGTDSSETTTEGLQSTTIETNVTDSSESTTEGVTESQGTTTSLVGPESTTDGSTTPSAESTTQVSTTESSESTESSTIVSGSESTGTETTVIGVTGSEGSTTEETATVSTTESSSEATGSTIENESTVGLDATTEGSSKHGFTASSPVWIFTTPRRQCIPRPRKCQKSEFGCCPDGKTAATGPFDEGCPHPRTCSETRHGCCSDGVSAAAGPDDQGCPTTACADTLFGCCQSDNKTAAQGNDQEGCPPPCAVSQFGCCADNETEATGPYKESCPESSTTTETNVFSTTEFTTFSTDGTTETESETGSTTESAETTTEMASCGVSEFGCCYDNETEATGPDGAGCPCSTTEFGCCPDGVSPAQGYELEGCQADCRASQFGCCNDGKTPAHGPDFEGCCLLHAHGCCPDNRNPAQGPNQEGCGCQYSGYGCCPDNVTIARGPDNQGCGCQYTPHGCCPDKHTEASGPDYKGCGCITFQFGCCPDGITTAIGPGHQGCHCQYSKYGCCGDNETPANGPDRQGCDCSNSKYGCCTDGNTEATGPKFLGCTDVPEDKQAVCSLGTDPGPGHNFTAFWYYDLAYGGCSRFWYGGTGGNGNRFATKDDCEDVCVQPAPKDACKLPGVKGPCEGDHIRWYYNSTHEQCMPFRYGGCLGNANNYDTRELCQQRCETDRTADQCSLPIEAGPCFGNYSRWGYDKATGKCEPFTWGGCEGNGNKFRTEIACLARCHPPGTLPPFCSEPQEAGNCSEKQALWAFSSTENRCLPFYYTGCDGNNNRFDSRPSCEETCPRTYEPDRCTLPAETGECANYREKWFYDTAIKRCRLFYYGGCGGNENNFNSEVECENTCSEAAIFTTTTTVRPTELTVPPTMATIPPTRPPALTTASQPAERPEFCYMEVDAGPCTGMDTRWAFDGASRRCKPFLYSGCGGNQNSFPSEEYCVYYCHPEEDVCQLPMQAGPCDDSVMSWFYDAGSDSCSQFTYGGCQGNGNRFETREACEARCRSDSSPNVDVRISEEGLPAECQITQTLEPCSEAGLVWYYDQARRECVSHQNQDSGEDCRSTGIFASQEACERSCGAFRGVDVCQQRMDAGPCDLYEVKVYFDQEAGECKEFSYGGCLGGANRFSTLEECAQICTPDPCSQQPDPGSCTSYETLWYYDLSRGECSTFVYTGCNGNENRFRSREECEGRCRAPVSTTTRAPPPQPPTNPECATPSSLEPCGEYSPVFYYDSTNRKCEEGGFGRCGYPNSYRSAEECERRCGDYSTLSPEDICTARLDPGPCRGSFQKFYWDSAAGKCDVFAYGGCRGGPNRFNSLEECEDFCGALGPAAACLERVDTGDYCEVAATRRYHYSPARGDCLVFLYQGCGGNHNNFLTYEQCAADCKVFRPADNNEVLDCRVTDEECSRLQCVHGVIRTPMENGCERCSCAQPPADPCEPWRRECETLDCPFGVHRNVEGGCERCICAEDPCASMSCGSLEHCEVTRYRDSATQQIVYSARCIGVDENEVTPDCGPYIEECSRLACQFGVQTNRLPNGCDRCSCVTIETDCELLNQECAQLKCTYGMERVTGADGCVRCRCSEVPCQNNTCAGDERCIVVPYRDALTQEPRYSAECRLVNKPGYCPMDNGIGDGNCRSECNDDADCRGVAKCCVEGCKRVCLPPELTPLTTTYAPDVPRAPEPAPDQEPEVSGSEGGKAVLRCLFHGNPPPRITWSYGRVTIDGDRDRYRLLSSGALEIVSLYRNDSGVYVCVADNGLGVASQSVTLVVNVPVSTHISPPGALTAGEELRLSCEVDGFPDPEVHWTKDGVRLQPDDRTSIAGSTVSVSRLSISRVTPADAGEYACHAANEYSSHSDSTVVTVNRGMSVPAKCTDNPFFANCDLIVRSNFCTHKYYSKFCCKSCVEAGQLDPRDAEMQADQPFRRK